MIRLATARDANALAQIYAPIVASTAISFELVPPSEPEMAARAASTLAYVPWLVCARDDEVWGYAYASRHNERAAYQWSLNVSAYVHESRRRHGVGRALYTSLFALQQEEQWEEQQLETVEEQHRQMRGASRPEPASARD